MMESDKSAERLFDGLHGVTVNDVPIWVTFKTAPRGRGQRGKVKSKKAESRKLGVGKKKIKKAELGKVMGKIKKVKVTKSPKKKSKLKAKLNKAKSKKGKK